MPSTWILSCLMVVGMFVGVPLALVHSEGMSFIGAFAWVCAIFAGVLLFVGLLVALDAWWERRRRS